jgi:hypothetical protein
MLKAISPSTFKTQKTGNGAVSNSANSATTTVLLDQFKQVSPSTFYGQGQPDQSYVVSSAGKTGRYDEFKSVGTTALASVLKDVSPSTFRGVVDNSNSRFEW